MVELRPLEAERCRRVPVVQTTFNGSGGGHENECRVAGGALYLAALADVQVDTVSRRRARGIMAESDAVISRVPRWRECTIVRWLEATGRMPEGE